ncbi:DUF6250 domain-containing protein [Brevundimonas variabilis]|uniref:DUF6250 domain-containing protein n=1 Tax=Brevundimonas variabilis TaxID=74312 RepID=A0A7W9FFM7_9CAUL|nr:DUF6250 domain-containing protein [Brevundimonas variabilis]MBB5747656.1 hypothetical protein [Brevundimonas variabilis]
MSSPSVEAVSGRLIHTDDFRSGLSLWAVDLERGGRVEAKAGAMHIDVPAGATVWFRTALQGPVMIEYQAVAVDEGGANDRVSDLNAFWMATDPSRTDGIPFPRSGAFASYDTLLTYYVGQGGNGNTTTRMRRYVGEAANRPLLAGHDLSGSEDLLRPNVVQRVRLVADGHRIEYWRDGRRVFRMDDPTPYRRGWFGIRTTASHLRISQFRVYALTPAESMRQPEASIHQR